MKRTERHTPIALLLLALLMFAFSACTVQKRVHNKGWFVQWHHQKTNSEKTHLMAEKISPDEVIATINASISTKTSFSENDYNSQEDGNTDEHITSDTTLLIEKETFNEKRFLTDPKESLLKKDNAQANKNRVVQSDNSNYASSPTRIPTVAWVLLYTGLLLVLIGIVAALIFAGINLTFIGLPLAYIVSLIAGIVLLILATGVALAPMKPQPSPPDPRYEKEEPKKEKKEREPLKKNDKIFLAVIAGILLGILLIALSS